MGRPCAPALWLSLAAAAELQSLGGGGGCIGHGEFDFDQLREPLCLPEQSRNSGSSVCRCPTVKLIVRSSLWSAQLHGAVRDTVSSASPSVSQFCAPGTLELWPSVCNLRWEQPLKRCLIIHLVLITKPPSRVCPRLPGASPRVISRAALNKQAGLWRPLPFAPPAFGE